MTGKQVLNSVSEALSEGLKILTIMEALLSNKEKRDPYPNPITDVHISKDGERIKFNFHWVKLFLMFQLNGKYITHGGEKKESIQFEYPLIWGRYDLENGLVIEKTIDIDSKIQQSPAGLGLDLVYGKFIYPLEQTLNCLLIIDQIIYKCLPEFMVKIEDLKLD